MKNHTVADRDIFNLHFVYSVVEIYHNLQIPYQGNKYIDYFLLGVMNNDVSDTFMHVFWFWLLEFSLNIYPRLVSMQWKIRILKLFMTVFLSYWTFVFSPAIYENCSFSIPCNHSHSGESVCSGILLLYVILWMESKASGMLGK